MSKFYLVPLLFIFVQIVAVRGLSAGWLLFLQPTELPGPPARSLGILSVNFIVL